MFDFDRRRLIKSGAGLVAIATLAGCGGPAPSSQSAEDDEALAAFVAALFPHDGIAPSIYQEVAASMQENLAKRSDWPALQQQGQAALNEASGGRFTALGPAEQAKAVEAVVATPFFGVVYRAALIEFYSHPEVWSHVGYPGSSVEYGGYLHRGFDDIDWLPDDVE